jgi:hypothetical protein
VNLVAMLLPDGLIAFGTAAVQPSQPLEVTAASLSLSVSDSHQPSPCSMPICAIVLVVLLKALCAISLTPLLSSILIVLFAAVWIAVFRTPSGLVVIAVDVRSVVVALAGRAVLPLGNVIAVLPGVFLRVLALYPGLSVLVAELPQDNM